MRSKSVVRTKSPAADRSTGRFRTRTATKLATPTRSKSVPRNILSPPPSTGNNSTASEHHIPIYRKYAEQVLQLTTSRSAAKPNKPQPATKNVAKSGDDIYMFDSPSQGSSASDGNEATTTGTGKPSSSKGSTAKKRSRLGSVSRNSKKTPLKKSNHHHPTVFGTDMYKISSVVKKIGGGPVRRKQDDSTMGGETATKNVVVSFRIKVCFSEI